MPEAGGAVLAFDFGTRRIGVALGTLLDSGRPGSSRPLTTIDAADNAARFAAVSALVDEWQPRHLLVGRPLNDDGSPHEMTARSERFANQLRGRFRIPVESVDERFSSTEAESGLRSRGLGWRERKAQLDAEAACVILDAWFSALPAARHAA